MMLIETSKTRKKILRKIDYLEEMGERVLTLQRKGLSNRQIRKRLFGKEMLMAYFTMGHFSGKNLVRSYIENRHGIDV